MPLISSILPSYSETVLDTRLGSEQNMVHVHEPWPQEELPSPGGKLLIYSFFGSDNIQDSEGIQELNKKFCVFMELLPMKAMRN